MPRRRRFALYRSLILTSLVGLAAGGVGTRSHAQLATLARDLPGDHYPTPSHPSGLRSVGSRVVFESAGPAGERALFGSDGTFEGTRWLAEFELGLGHYVGSTSTLSFWQYRKSDGDERRLIATDGTPAGTRSFVVPFFTDVVPVSVRLGERLLFIGDDGASRHLVFSDGTPGGTELLPTSTLGAGQLVAAEGAAYFTAGFPPEIWRSNGTVESSIALLPWLNGEVLVGLDEVLVGISTSGGQRSLRAISPGGVALDLAAADSVNDLPEDRIWSNGTILVAATREGAFDGLLISDGSSAGTWKSGPLPGVLVRAAALNGRRFFFQLFVGRSLELWVADDGNRSVQQVVRICDECQSAFEMWPAGQGVVFTPEYSLWVSDGTAAGTLPIPEAGQIRAPALLADEDLVFLVGTSAGDRIYRSNGTMAGTFDLLEDAPNQWSFDQPELAATLTHAFFAADDGTTGTELHTALLSGGLSKLVRDLSPPSSGGDPLALVPAASGSVVFSAGVLSGEGSLGGLWLSDGTDRGTRRKLTQLQACENSSFELFQRIADRILFTCSGRPGLRSVALDGTGLTKVFAAVTTLSLRGATAHGLVFLGQRGDESLALFVSDGTTIGSLALRELSFQTNIFPAGEEGGRLYFWLVEASGGDLWRTDGTLIGTVRLTDRSAPAAPDISPDLAIFAVNRFANRTLFLARESGTLGIWELDTSDFGAREAVGGAPLPSLQTALFNMGSYLLFGGEGYLGGVYSSGLFRTDLTVAGTSFLGAVRPPTYFFDAPPPLKFGDRLFFVADDNQGTLWSSNGTPGGTQPVRTTFGGGLTHMTSLVTAAGRLFVSARGDGPQGVSYGKELWVVRQPAGLAELAHDILPGAFSSSPGPLIQSGDRLFFIATDGLHGYDLYSVPLTGDSQKCRPGEQVLCLTRDRFQVETSWRDFQGNTGRGNAVELTPDTGYFWFFNEENVESVVKVLDARVINDWYWTFAGALTNVEYSLTVSDAVTGASKRYSNPSGRFASFGDTQSLNDEGISSFARTDSPRWASSRLVSFHSRARAGARNAPGTLRALGEPGTSAFVATPTTQAMSVCVPTETRLCLTDNRFAVEVTWKDFQGGAGAGQAVPLTPDTGYFWFFTNNNVELVLKVLDARSFADAFWVFYGALSNVEYAITVTDTETGEHKTYPNPSGQFGSVGDTAAFPE